MRSSGTVSKDQVAQDRIRGGRVVASEIVILKF